MYYMAYIKLKTRAYSYQMSHNTDNLLSIMYHAEVQDYIQAWERLSRHALVAYCEDIVKRLSNDRANDNICHIEFGRYDNKITYIRCKRTVDDVILSELRLSNKRVINKGL